MRAPQGGQVAADPCTDCFIYIIIRFDLEREDAMSKKCHHLDQIHEAPPSAQGCEDCLRAGGQWVHLRLCLTCGHIGCCDSSPNQHATKHFHAKKHPL